MVKLSEMTHEQLVKELDRVDAKIEAEFGFKYKNRRRTALINEIARRQGIKFHK